MLLLNKENIESIFTMKDAIESNKKAFEVFSNEYSINPIRTNISIEKENSNTLFMPGHIGDLDVTGVKIVSVYPKNREVGKDTIPSSIILIDSKCGEVISILDGTYITKLRTGAATGAALDILANKDAKVATLIGTGSQSFCQLEAMLEARDLEDVYVYSKTFENCYNFVKDAKTKLNKNVNLIPVNTLDNIIEKSQIIVTVTNSKEPVFDGTKVRPGTTISAVGAYMPTMAEFDLNLISKADKIYFDSKEAILEESGEIINALNKKVITEDDFTGELGDVINNKILGRENKDEIIIFKSVGIGTQDIITSKDIYDKAMLKGIGTQWE